MSLLSALALPAGFLILCLNAALASIVICAIALVMSLRHRWSLPTRHAFLVAALAASLLAPFVAPLFPLSPLWTVPGPEGAVRPKKSAASQPTGNSGPSDGAASTVSGALTIAELSSEPSPSSELAVTVSGSVPNIPASHATLSEQPAAARIEWAWIIGTLLCSLWFVGIAASLVRAVQSVARFRRWMQTVSYSESPQLAAAARRAAEGVGLKKDVAIYCSNLLPAPVTLGLIHPRIVVPAGIELTLPPEQLRAVIQHEMAHIARRDLWVGLLQQLAQIFIWWNPLVRLANRQVADFREQICDDIAIRELLEPGAYAATLLNIAERCNRCAPIPMTLGIGSAPARQLESRIRRIVCLPKARCVRLSRTAAVGVSALTILMAATIVLGQVQIESPAAEESAGHLATNPEDSSIGPAEFEKADHLDPDSSPPQRQAEIAGPNAYRWAFGGDGDAISVEKVLDQTLQQKIAIIDRACRLTDVQKDKLLLAGRGDIKRFTVRVDEIGTRMQRVKEDPKRVEALGQEVYALARSLVVPGLPPERLLFIKTLDTILTDEQLAMSEPFRAVYQVGGLVQAPEQAPRADTLLINLNGTEFTDDGLSRLKGLTGLKSLLLSGTRVTDQGLVHLKGLTGLQTLFLRGPQITDAGAAHLKGLTSLQWLRLDDTQLTDAGLRQLGGLAELQLLSLDGTRVTDAGLDHLQGMSDLQTLGLMNTQVTDAGLRPLKRLRKLQRLVLDGTQVTNDGVAELKLALPDVIVSR